MFRNVVGMNDSPYTGDIADRFFGRISGEAFRNDYSFLSTTRALLFPRMGEEDTLHIQWHSKHISKDELAKMEPEQILAHMIDFEPNSETDTIRIYNVNGNSDENKTILESIEYEFPRKYTNFKLNSKIKTFFLKCFPVLCFQDEEKKNVILFIDFMDIRKMHYIQMAILPMFPWYFNPADGVSADEMALVQSFQKETRDEYLTALGKLVERYDLRTMRIKALLEGFERRRFDAELERYTGEAESIAHRIHDYQEQLNNFIKDHSKMLIRIAGVRAAMENESGDSEMMDFFCCNKNLHLSDVNGSRITFYATGDLEYWDKDVAESVIKNHRSFMYNHVSNKDEMEKFYRAVFIDEKIKLRFCGAYYIEFGGGANALSGYDFPANASTYMPNPHINDYSCVGNHSRIFTELMREGNYIGTITQCMASCRSLNFSDSTVMSRFVSNVLNDSNRRFVELPDGKIVTVTEAISWLKDN